MKTTELIYEEIALYLVLTERHVPKKEGAEIKTTDYRVLSRSVMEAAQIIIDGFHGEEGETIVEVRKASHITRLPTSMFKIVFFNAPPEAKL